MSIAAVRDYLTPFGLADKILEFSTSSATVELAAQAAGLEGSVLEQEGEDAAFDYVRREVLGKWVHF